MNKTFRFLVITVSFVVVFLFTFPLPMRSQCNPDLFKARTEIRIVLPNVVKVAIVDSTNPDALAPFMSIDIPQKDLDAKTWEISQPNIDDIKTKITQAKERNIDRANIMVGWIGADNSIIGSVSGLKAFKLEGETDEQVCKKTPTSKPNGKAPGKTMSSRNEVGDLWNEWLAEIETDMRDRLKDKGNYVAILFDQTLKVTRVSREYGAVGDMIYAGVLRNKKDPTGNVSVEYSPCDLEPSAPNIYVGGTLDITGKQGSVDVFVIDKFPPRRCYNSSVTIKVEKVAKNEVTNKEETTEGQYIWQQYQRYRATLQLGILFTDTQDQTYGIRKDGDKTVIYSKGPEDKGPSYVTSLVIYSFPRYLTSIFSSKSRFQGRDILHDNDFIDRINAVLSVGINNPGRRFSFGLSFEVVYGVNIVGVYEYARITELAGLKVGDEFTGAADTIPTHDVWKKKLTFGLSIDLRYVTALFSKR